MPLVLSNGTELVLTPLSGLMTPILTPYSARGVTSTIEVTAGSGGGERTAALRRDVNGILRDVSDERFRKYIVTFTCRDGEAPSLDGAWIGAEVDVSCPFEFSYPVGGSPQRAEVSGSARTQGNFIYYRPLLLMRVAAIRDATPEYAATHNWELKLEEV